MNRSDESEQRHRRVWELIPWVVNGRASDSERSLVEQHVQRCGDCAGELGFQRQLHRVMAQEEPPPPAAHEAALQRLWQRIDGMPPARPARRAAAPAQRWPWRALLAVVLLQAIGLGALGAMLWARPAPRLASAQGGYRTLSLAAAVPARATVRAVFAPEATEQQLQALLARSGLEIVGGPSDAGAFALAPLAPAGGAPTAQLLQRLRADPLVRFAEALPGPGLPP